VTARDSQRRAVTQRASDLSSMSRHFRTIAGVPATLELVMHLRQSDEVLTIEFTHRVDRRSLMETVRVGLRGLLQLPRSVEPVIQTLTVVALQFTELGLAFLKRRCQLRVPAKHPLCAGVEPQVHNLAADVLTQFVDFGLSLLPTRRDEGEGPLAIESIECWAHRGLEPLGTKKA